MDCKGEVVWNADQTEWEHVFDGDCADVAHFTTVRVQSGREGDQ
jgi:hypothetical protein